MPRVTLIGAGSVEFTKTLVADLLRYPELRGAELVLHDVDARRLQVAEAMVRRVDETLGTSARVRATLDRHASLDGADYVLFLVQVGGHDATVADFELPKRHGIRATIADTLGIGGVFRALRTFPVICATADEMTELCPDAWLLNYTNPMAMLCRAVATATAHTRTVGLCHSVQHTAAKLGRIVGVDEVDHVVAGVNHLAFFLRFASVDGEDLYPRLREAVELDPEGLGRTARAELFRRFGWFVTESSEHLAEYVPWFLGDEDAIERFRIPLDEYVRRSAGNLQRFEEIAAAVERGEELPLDSSDEYAPAIVHALETGREFRFNGNVPNDGLIENLPDGACVEVPCIAGPAGVVPQTVGALPPQLAALDRAYLEVVELAVRAYRERSRDLVYAACAVDPGMAAQGVTLERVQTACDDLFAAHAPLLGRDYA